MALRAGITLGRYQLLQKVGAGGMSEVYRAHDQTLERSVAVKVILDPIAENKEFSERFLREARLVAGLEHPNILPIYDFGSQSIDGKPISFLVMPLVTGGSLKDRIKGPVPPSQAVEWLCGIAAALDHAHKRGILHRDIKPGNVLLDATGRTLLADFGLARMADATSGLTATGTVMGTPLYMAPEQAQGEKVDARADQYAVGIIAFELLTGRVPFKADSPLAILHQHVTRPPEPISLVLPQIPRSVDSVMSRCLAKAPHERFASCSEFVKALSVALGVSMPAVTSGPVQISPETAPIPAPMLPHEADSRAATIVSREVPAPPPPPPPPLPQPVSLTAPASANVLGKRRFLLIPAGIAALVLLTVLLLGVLKHMGKARQPATASLEPPVMTPLPAPLATATAVPAPVSAAEVTPPEEVEATPGPVELPLAEVPESLPSPVPATPKAGSPGPQIEKRPSVPAGPSRERPPAEPREASLKERAPAPAEPVLVFRNEPTVGGSAGYGDSSLGNVYEALDASRKPGRRLEKSDFAQAAGEVRQIKQRSPGAETGFLDAFSRAGLAFADGRNQEAWVLLNRALASAPSSSVTSRRLQFVDRLMSSRGNLPGTDGAWIMGLAFDDVRGDLEEELEKALEKSPTNGALHYARSLHAAARGQNLEAAESARRACQEGLAEACNMVGRGRSR